MPLVLGAGLALEASGLRLNLTPSLPRGVYREAPGSPGRGRLVLVCLPPALAEAGRGRGLLRRGECPGGVEPLLKRVAAVAGDRVRVGVDGVRVDGVLLPASQPHRSSALGPPLSRGERSLVLRPGELWLHAPHRDSWDSRDFGPVEASSVLALARPVWTRPPPEGAGDSRARGR